MMTSALCIEKAEYCDAQASRWEGGPVDTGWQDLAGHWRRLAADGTAQATLARLMSASRQPRA